MNVRHMLSSSYVQYRHIGLTMSVCQFAPTNRNSFGKCILISLYERYRTNIDTSTWTQIQRKSKEGNLRQIQENVINRLSTKGETK